MLTSQVVILSLPCTPLRSLWSGSAPGHAPGSSPWEHWGTDAGLLQDRYTLAGVVHQGQCVLVCVLVLTGDILLLLGRPPSIVAVQADGAAVVHWFIIGHQDGLLVPGAGGQPAQLASEDIAINTTHEIESLLHPTSSHTLSEHQIIQHQWHNATDNLEYGSQYSVL